MDKDFLSNSLDISILKHSSIILSTDFLREIDFLRDIISPANLRIFHTNELRAGHPSNAESSKNSTQLEKYIYIRDIIQEIFTTSIEKKYLAILANTYNIDAQNALLRVIEEPPKNIIFLLFASAKNKLLPTIHSRLMIYDNRIRGQIKEFELDLSKISAPIIYDYIQEINSLNMNFNEAKDVVYSILNKALKQNLMLDEKQLQRFQSSIDVLNKKGDIIMALTPLLLSFLKECRD